MALNVGTASGTARLLGPYEAAPGGRIAYRGNRLFGPIDDVRDAVLSSAELSARVRSLAQEPWWPAVARMNDAIFQSSVDYFAELGARFTLLPLTTRMISSPGAVYGREAIDYTTDTAPVTLEWFDLERCAFLAESSQIYLELALLSGGADHVYAIYNSFRKERADATHLSEFHHIEYEGVVSAEENTEIALGLLARITQTLVAEHEGALAAFLEPAELAAVADVASPGQICEIGFGEALELLREHTGDDRYAERSLRHFSAWEEILLTQLTGALTVVHGFPLLEVPFYHAELPGADVPTAHNCDVVWPAYREVVGAGRRIAGRADLEAKARVFNLPPDDYAPYLQSREMPGYRPTSGFGLGWERLVQGLLRMPFIWSASQFPRGDSALTP